MIKIKQIICMALLTAPAFLHAQEVKLSDLLNEESKLTLAKQQSELAKSAPILPTMQMPGSMAINSLPNKPVKKVNSQPQTFSIFGIAPDYQAEMIIDGKAYLVKKGDKINSHIVVSINSKGVMMASISSTPTKVTTKRKYKKPTSKQKAKPVPRLASSVVKKSNIPLKSPVNTRFYPLKPE